MNRLSKILIVELEYVLEEEMLCRLFELGHEIVKTVYNSNDALEYLEQNDVDIVLIEMNMDGKLKGFQLTENLNSTFNVPFIILAPTIIQAHLDMVKEASPSAILIHPTSLQQIHLSIALAISNFNNSKSSNFAGLIENPTMDLLNNCLFFKKSNYFERVNFNDIFWLRAENNYTVIHTSKGDFIYSTVLKKFIEKLPMNQFIRVHRSYIINLSKIEGFEGKMVIIDNDRIPVAKNCQKKIFDLLQTV